MFKKLYEEECRGGGLRFVKVKSLAKKLRLAYEINAAMNIHNLLTNILLFNALLESLNVHRNQ